MNVTLSNKRKVYCFNLRKFWSRRKTQIRNQCTIFGCLFKLKMNEKLLIALVKLKTPGLKDKMTPIIFKVPKDKLPTDLKFQEKHIDNLVVISLPECKPFPALIVAGGGKYSSD